MNFNLLKASICKRLVATSLDNAVIIQRVEMFILELGKWLRERMLLRPWVQVPVMLRTKEKFFSLFSFLYSCTQKGTLLKMFIPWQNRKSVQFEWPVNRNAVECSLGMVALRRPRHGSSSTRLQL